VPEIHNFNSAKIVKRQAACRKFSTGFSTAVEKQMTHNSKNRSEFCCFPKLEKCQDCVCIAIIFLQRARKVTYEVLYIQQKKTEKILLLKNEYNQYSRRFQKGLLLGNPENKGEKKSLTKKKILMENI